MKNLFLIHKIDVKESVRSKWFIIYTLVFGSVIAVFFADGVGQYAIYEFLGLNKMLLMYIQVSLVVLPIFVLISTITSIIKEKENNTLEYMLSFSISLKQYYWGKFIGRFVTMILPLLFALVIGIIYGTYQGLELELNLFYIYLLILVGLCVFFLGVSFFASSFLRNQEIALSSAFFIWIFFLAFIDLILIQVLLQAKVPSELIIGISIINPIELVRVSSMMLFDANLKTLGAVSYYILDTFDKETFITISVIYPMLMGLLLALIGYKRFEKNDLV